MTQSQLQQKGARAERARGESTKHPAENPGQRERCEAAPTGGGGYQWFCSVCFGQKKTFKDVTPSFFFLGSRFFEYIFLYQSLVMFQIDQKTKDCSKIALTEAWDPFDIPANSTFEDQKPARQHETWVGVYTLKDCYPVQETYVRNSSVTTSTRFFNLQLGISDPDVFTPPSTCQSARPERMSESEKCSLL
uniref:Mammalian ependymin-related protein 1 n=1 Tax=Labrus bergylta TaxID=56723 RepID=A0A3Q3MP76_9LABR